MKPLRSWTICQNFSILARVIDGGQLVYHSGNGNTHWLSAESSFVFSLLWNCKSPMTTELLVTQVQQSGFNKLDSLSLEEILQELCALYLVETS